MKNFMGYRSRIKKLKYFRKPLKILDNTVLPEQRTDDTPPGIDELQMQSAIEESLEPQPTEVAHHGSVTGEATVPWVPDNTVLPDDTPPIANESLSQHVTEESLEPQHTEVVDDESVNYMTDEATVLWIALKPHFMSDQGGNKSERVLKLLAKRIINLLSYMQQQLPDTTGDVFARFRMLVVEYYEIIPEYLKSLEERVNANSLRFYCSEYSLFLNWLV